MLDESRQTLVGRAVLDDRVVAARIEVVGNEIEALEEDEAGADGPYLSPGFVDVHVHGWGGHDAMGDEAALDGMARALLRHGVTSFLPSAVTSPLDRLAAFADRVRAWMLAAPADGAQPLGFNIEGPCISPEKKGAQNEAFIKPPSAVDRSVLEPMLDGLRIMTVAPSEWAHSSSSVGSPMPVSTSRWGTRTPARRRRSVGMRRGDARRRTCSTPCRASITTDLAWRSPP